MESESTQGDPKDSTIAQKLENLPTMVADLNSSDPNLQLSSITAFRKLLLIEKSPPIDKVIALGVVPRFVEFLNFADRPQFQVEAAWVLTNISSGSSDQTRVVIDAGVVPVFVKLLNSPSDEVREQVVWGLGNIAGDSPHTRDLVLQFGALEPLLNQLHASSKLSMIRNATWTLSNFCRGKPPPPSDFFQPALRALSRLIHSSDEDVLADTCWALSYLSSSKDKIQNIIDSGVCTRLVELLKHTNFSVQTPALRTIGNIVTGNDIQTQAIVSNVSTLPSLLALMGSPKKGFRKEACWTISNITAGDRAQIAAVIDAGMIPPLIQLLDHNDYNVTKEAAWAIINATFKASSEQIRYLVTCGCLKPLCALLSDNNVRVISVVLNGLENILKMGSRDANSDPNSGGVNVYAFMIEEVEGLEKIEALQKNPNHDIYQQALSLLETYFVFEREEDGEALNPNMDAPQQQTHSLDKSPVGGFELNSPVASEF